MSIFNIHGFLLLLIMRLYCVGCEKDSDCPEIEELGIIGMFSGICEDCKKVIANIKKHKREDLL